MIDCQIKERTKTSDYSDEQHYKIQQYIFKQLVDFANNLLFIHPVSWSKPQVENSLGMIKNFNFKSQKNQ